MPRTLFVILIAALAQATPGATAQSPHTVLWKFKMGNGVFSSPAIGTDGTLHVGSPNNKAYATKTSGVGLAKTAWPKFGQNAQHAGCATAAVPTAEVKPGPVAGAKKAQNEPRSPRQQPTKSSRFTE
jgi:hypothetical protein